MKGINWEEFKTAQPIPAEEFNDIWIKNQNRLSKGEEEEVWKGKRLHVLQAPIAEGLHGRKLFCQRLVDQAVALVGRTLRRLVLPG